MPQYRVEITAQAIFEDTPKLCCKGDIVGSKDIANVIYDNVVAKYNFSVQGGWVKMAKIRLMVRPWPGWFSTWEELDTSTITKDGPEVA